MVVSCGRRIHSGKSNGFDSALLRRCDVREVPVAMVAGSVETDAALPEPLRHVAIMPAVGKPFGSEQTIAGASQLMEAAADRMFQFFRIGRGL